MNNWVILEIDPTTDISIIKKAYAKKLKLNHPEDDPKGYQILREAYDKALKDAKQYTYSQEAVRDLHYETNGTADSTIRDNTLKDTTIKDNTIKDNTIKDNAIKDNTIKDNKKEDLELNKRNDYDEGHYNRLNIAIPDERIDERITREQLINEFFNKVDQLYMSFFERFDVNQWEQLLNDEIMWQLETKEYINKRVLDYFLHHQYLSRDVWKLLNKIFHWDEQELYLKKNYSSSFTKYLFLQLGEEIVPRFCNFDKKDKIDYDEYLSFREQALLALFDNKLQNAEQLISLALSKYSKDPDLFCMKGEYYYRIGKPERAASEFRSAIRITPDDLFIINYQAKILYYIGRYKEALEICSSIISRNKNLQEVNLLAGQCLFELHEYIDASKVFISNIKRNPFDIHSKRYLKKIQYKFRNYLDLYPIHPFYRYRLIRINHALNKLDSLKE